MTNQIKIRPAELTDAEPLWHWRNDPATRQFAFSQNTVDWEAHSNWFSSALRNPDRIILIACDCYGQRMGMVRFDINKDAQSALTSINLAPAARGKRQSIPILSAAIETFSTERQCDLIAEIKPDNIASIKCFQACGFVQTRVAEDRLTFSRSSKPGPVAGD